MSPGIEGAVACPGAPSSTDRALGTGDDSPVVGPDGVDEAGDVEWATGGADAGDAVVRLSSVDAGDGPCVVVVVFPSGESAAAGSGARGVDAGAVDAGGAVDVAGAPGVSPRLSRSWAVVGVDLAEATSEGPDAPLAAPSPPRTAGAAGAVGAVGAELGRDRSGETRVCDGRGVWVVSTDREPWPPSVRGGPDEAETTTGGAPAVRPSRCGATSGAPGAVPGAVDRATGVGPPATVAGVGPAAEPGVKTVPMGVEIVLGDPVDDPSLVTVPSECLSVEVPTGASPTTRWSPDPS